MLIERVSINHVDNKLLLIVINKNLFLIMLGIITDKKTKYIIYLY